MRLIEEKRIKVRKRQTETLSAFLWFPLKIATYFYILSYIIYPFDSTDHLLWGMSSIKIGMKATDDHSVSFHWRVP